MVEMQTRVQNLEQLVDELQAGRGTSGDDSHTAPRLGLPPGAAADSNDSPGVASEAGPAAASASGSSPSCRRHPTLRAASSDWSSGPSAPSKSSAPLTTPSLFQQFLPDAATVQLAVDAFFSCSGKLFHVFTAEQVAVYHHAVFAGGSSAVQTSGPMVCCLMAVAAIGAQYVEGILSRDSEVLLYDAARHNLEDVLEHRPYDAIKVCTLLCMYNVLNKTTAALAYSGTILFAFSSFSSFYCLLTARLEIGLAMCRRFGLHLKHGRQPSMSEDVWIDYRRTWRTLVFFGG